MLDQLNRDGLTVKPSHLRNSDKKRDREGLHEWQLDRCRYRHPSANQEYHSFGYKSACLSNSPAINFLYLFITLFLVYDFT